MSPHCCAANGSVGDVLAAATAVFTLNAARQIALATTARAMLRLAARNEGLN